MRIREYRDCCDTVFKCGNPSNKEEMMLKIIRFKLFLDKRSMNEEARTILNDSIDKIIFDLEFQLDDCKFRKDDMYGAKEEITLCKKIISDLKNIKKSNKNVNCISWWFLHTNLLGDYDLGTNNRKSIHDTIIDMHLKTIEVMGYKQTRKVKAV